MLFSIGTKVKFLHTDDEGVIRALLGEGMVSVYLPHEDMEIPAAEDDLIRAEDVRPSKVKAKIVQGKKEQADAKPPPVKIETQYAILKSYGLQMAFLPLVNHEGMTEKYELYLLNDTTYDAYYQVKLLLNYRSETWDGKLPATSYVKMGEMLFDDLNEAPEIEADCKWASTEGIGENRYKLLKIKAKSFFKTVRTIPFLNQPAHWYKLFDSKEKSEIKPAEDLKTYTKKHAKPAWQLKLEKENTTIYSSSELAEFNPEKDLHIEALTDSWRRLPKVDILRIQLAEFDKYLDKAIRLGVPNIFVIHGVGEGKLKNAIATRLFKHPEVKTFKNEFHPKYGWGATEIIF